MNRLKKMLASLLALAMVITMMPVMDAYASSISVSGSPLSSTVKNMPISDLINQINAGGATYTYVDNEGNTATGKVTADMCYLYGTLRINGNAESTKDIAEGSVLFTASSPQDDDTAFKSLKVTDLARADLFYKDTTKASNIRVVENTYTLSVRINDTNHDFTFKASTPEKIFWPDTLTKTSYWVGDTLDLTGDYVTIGFRNGDTGKEPITADMLYGISLVPEKYSVYNRYVLAKAKASEYMNTPGKYSFAVAYKSINSTFNSRYGLDTTIGKDQFMAGQHVAGTTNLADGIYSANGPKVYEITVSAASGYTPKLRYSAHVQNIGWQGFYYSPDTAGTTGKSLRMEALKVQFVNYNSSMGTLEYMAHIQNIGDTKWITADEMVGTVGESKRMEGVAIRFTGKYAELYNVEYRVHVQGIGWTDWKKNGEYAGTKTEAKRMEAVEIKTSLK